MFSFRCSELKKLLLENVFILGGKCDARCAHIIEGAGDKNYLNHPRKSQLVQVLSCTGSLPHFVNGIVHSRFVQTRRLRGSHLLTGPQVGILKESKDNVGGLFFGLAHILRMSFCQLLYFVANCRLLFNKQQFCKLFSYYRLSVRVPIVFNCLIVSSWDEACCDLVRQWERIHTGLA